MLPIATAAGIPPTAVDLVSIAAVDVRVAIEIIIVVDGDIAAAVPVAISPGTAPGGSKGETGPKRQCSVARRIGVGIGICRRPVNHGRTVLRNVDHLGIGRLDNDDLLVIDSLRLDLLLLCRF